MASTATRPKPGPAGAKRPSGARPAPPAPAPARGRRRWLIAGGLAVVVAAGSAVVVGARGSHGGSGAVPTEQPLAAYRVVYHVTQEKAPTYDEERIVRRPYEAIDISRNSTGVVTGVLTNGNGFWQYMTGSGGEGWKQFEDGPRGAVGDYRPIPQLDRVIASGQARVVGHDTVLGRHCVVVRTGQPIGSSLEKPTASSHADTCLDASGVPLRERWTLNGKLIRQMDATVFDTNPAITSETFHPTPTLDRVPPGVGGMPVVAALDDSSRRSISYVITPPSGYQLDGGEVQVRIDPNAVMDQQIVERFTRGSDLLTVTHMGTPAAALPGERIGLPEGATGYLVVDLNEARLTVVRDGAVIMRIEGADPDVVVAAARTLHHR